MRTTLTFLTINDVIAIHDALTRDFAESADPISPPGIKNIGLLESAVGRQQCGYDGELKYRTIEENAATLCYGICCNHPMHNGNKRTALVALLCHLDKNNRTFNGRALHEDLYSFMLKVAAHKFAPPKIKYDSSDVEIQEMARWIKKNTRKIERSERIVTYRELEQILKRFNVWLEPDQGNYANVCMEKEKEVRTALIFRKKIAEKQVVANIPFFKDGRHVGKNLIKTIRASCNLTPEHGIDSGIFYGDQTTVDEFILKYKGTLKRLAKT